jgi:hypothetical protein
MVLLDFLARRNCRRQENASHPLCGRLCDSAEEAPLKLPALGSTCKTNPARQFNPKEDRSHPSRPRDHRYGQPVLEVWSAEKMGVFGQVLDSPIYDNIMNLN